MRTPMFFRGFLITVLCVTATSLAEPPSATPAAAPLTWQQELFTGRDSVRQGNYSDAEQSLQAALSGAEQSMGHDTLAAAATANELGKLYRLIAKYDQADALDHRALDIRTHLLGDNDPLVAVVLENLGELDILRGFYANADKELRRALEIRTSQCGEESAEAADTEHRHAPDDRIHDEDQHGLE